MEQRSQASVQELQEKIAAIFRGVGVPGPDADIAADALMDAEISGVESHGLTRLKAYVDRITNGQMNPAPEIQIETRGAVARVDGGNGMGQVVAARAARLCVQLAKQYGIGAAAVHRSNHFGTAAYYANRVARAGCVGFCATNASMFDVFVAIFFGFLGYLMNKFSLSSAALILGLILGGTAESGLMLSLVMAKGDVLGYYFGRPICLVLMALIVLSIAGPVISNLRAKNKKKTAA